MDFLVTLIGNAVVDPVFRKRILNNPIDTADEYGFRFTKSDFEMMKTMFVGLTQTEKNDLEQQFKVLQDMLLKKIVQLVPQKVCHPPCALSIYPPPEPHELREEWVAAAA
jgi:hypothetical protein